MSRKPLTIEDIDFLQGMVDRDFASVEEQIRADQILDDLRQGLREAQKALLRMLKQPLTIELGLREPDALKDGVE
jgi:hypothetical protein